MKEEKIKQDRILKDIAVGVIFILLVALTIMLARDRLYSPQMESEYLGDTTYINMEYHLKITAADGNELVKVLRSYDSFADKLEDDELYSDFVIYGDEEYEKANDIFYKIAYLDNIVGNLNWYKEDINSLLKELKGDDKRQVKYLVEKLRKDIQETNYWIDEYDEVKNETYSKVYLLTEEIK